MGSWTFFLQIKAWGLGAAIMPPVGPEQRPGGGPGGKSLGSSIILVILGVKLAFLGEVTSSLKRRNVPLLTLLK